MLRVDETKIKIFGFGMLNYIWRKPNTAENNTLTLKHGGGSMMLRRWFSLAGSGPLPKTNPKYWAALKESQRMMIKNRVEI